MDREDRRYPSSQPPEVLVIRPPAVFTVHEQYISNKFQILKAYDSPLPTHDFLQSNAQSVKAVLCAGSPPITADVLQDLPALQLVVSVTTGVNHIDMAECRRRGIRVTNVGDVFSADVADAAVGLLIDVMRRISGGDKFVRGGCWPVTEQFPLGSKDFHSGDFPAVCRGFSLGFHSGDIFDQPKQLLGLPNSGRLSHCPRKANGSASVIQNWRDMYSKNGRWVNKAAGRDWKKIEDERHRMEKEAGDGPINEEECLKRALGERRGWIRGIGQKVRSVPFDVSRMSSHSQPEMAQLLESIRLLTETVKKQGEELKRVKT